MLSQRPAWAEITLSAIHKNVQEFKKLIATGVKLCAVVKADGYGHGAEAVAKTALAAGADFLSVAILQEAVTLRQSGFTCPILVMGYTPTNQAHVVVSNEIAQTIYSMDQAEALSAAASACGTKAIVHIKVDTGMARLGLPPCEAGEFAAAVAKLPNIIIEGVFTHFAQADSEDKTFAMQQFALFEQALEAIEAKNIKVAIRHCANSAATLDLPNTHLDMVRVGISLYGLWPSSEVKQCVTLTPAMSFKVRVAHIKTVPAGTAISYGGTFVTKAPSLIATLPVGYADGWTRMLSGEAKVLIHGHKVPIVGRICMDQCMVDVSSFPQTRVGDEVLLFGGSTLPAEEVAAHLNTINYEMVCMVGKRVPRLYL